MESSEEEEDFPTHEWITPQSQIDSMYQSQTEKGIRKVCSELLDLKEAVENLHGNMHTKYLSFLRISDEVSEMKHELIELQKHASAQAMLIQDLISGACHELEAWSKDSRDEGSDDTSQTYDMDSFLLDQTEDPRLAFLEKLDVLLAEHNVEELVSAIVKEVRNCPELNDSDGNLQTQDSSYRIAFLKRKDMLVEQLIEMTEQPFIGNVELKQILSSLLRLGEGILAHDLFLRVYSSRLLKSIEAILPSFALYTETYTSTLSQLVFSTISLAATESSSIFGDTPSFNNRMVQWAESEIESFIRLVKENAALPESASALCSASICFQASLSYCSKLASQGLKFSEVLLVLLQPYIGEVLEMNFKRARRRVLEQSSNDQGSFLSSELCLPISAAATSNYMLTNSGEKFMVTVNDILKCVTPMVFSHFGGQILEGIILLFDRYVESLMKALPGPSEDDNNADQKEEMEFRVETDAQQLALLGTAYTVADELLPCAVSRQLHEHSESREPGNSPLGTSCPIPISVVDLKEWRRQLQLRVEKLRDHFCRQYVLTFIYSREDKTRLDAQVYLNCRSEDIFWDSDPRPSLLFQALFARLQQLESVAKDILKKEKLQKSLLARLVETVVMWLSEEHEFYALLEESEDLPPSGLQQLILDMHFIVEITIYGGYQSKIVQRIVPAIITRAIEIFSKKGIDPQSALPEDEWFVDAAKTAIHKLQQRVSDSDLSETDDRHIILTGDISDSDVTISSITTSHSLESFASANMDETGAPVPTLE